MVEKSMLWPVKNGRDIHVWNDMWILDHGSNFVKVKCRADVNETMKVPELIDPNLQWWDLTLASSLVEDEDKEMILRIPLRRFFFL